MSKERITGENSAFSVQPVDATFGAIITDIKLAGLNDADFNALYSCWLEYGLLIFPGQHLSEDEQIAFARRFGKLEIKSVELSNVKPDGALRPPEGDDMVNILKGNMGWHCDSTYMPVQAKGAVFTAHVLPTHGGDTEWADARAAYEALDEEMKSRLSNMSAYHSLYYSQRHFAHKDNEDSEYFGYGFHDQDPPLRPLIKIHPETGRPALNVGRHAYGLAGMSEEASEKFLEDLIEFTCQAPRLYAHQWTVGDAVLWDNRRLLHRACPWDMSEARVMRHSRIAGEQESEFAAHS